MKRLYVLAPLFLVSWFILGFSNSVFAWGVEAHLIIAYIAETRLTLIAKEKILEEFQIKSLADVATWADEIKKKF